MNGSQSFAPGSPSPGGGASGFGFDDESITVSVGGFLATSSPRECSNPVLAYSERLRAGMRAGSRFLDLPPPGPQVDPAARMFTIEQTAYGGVCQHLPWPRAGGRKQWR